MNLIRYKAVETLKANGRLMSSLTIVVALLFVGVAGCGKSKYTFSSIHNGFDPENNFRQNGFIVNRETHSGSGVSNPPYGYAWTSWQGVMTTTKTNGCDLAGNLLCDAIKNSTQQWHEELTDTTRPAGSPLVGLIMYNKDGMHGEIHVWLLPDSTGTNINYVIFLREEPFKG
jgi:hypothetical protein